MKKVNLIRLIVIISLVFLTNFNINAQNTDNLVINSIYWGNKPESFTIKENTLIIDAGANTNMFRAPDGKFNADNAPKLLFKPDDNFVLIASIELSFKNKWDAGALVIKSDSLNWIKYCFEKDYTGAKRIVSVVTRNISDDCNSVEINSDKVFFKIAKADKVFTLYYSTNGENWFLVRHFQFETKPEFEVGFLAQSPIGPNCEVRFSDFKYEPKKIKDPYLGE
jgi:regulation of enolase protein 1 (concanavalin A-like superfamily)